MGFGLGRRSLVQQLERWLPLIEYYKNLLSRRRLLRWVWCWGVGFRLVQRRCLIQLLAPWLLLYIKLEFVIVAVAATMNLELVCWLCTCSTMSRPATGPLVSFLYMIRICYCGGCCSDGSGSGVLGLRLADDVSNSYWTTGFRL